jgi:hypothetical protein
MNLKITHFSGICQLLFCRNRTTKRQGTDIEIISLHFQPRFAEYC